EIENGEQVERPENWLKDINPWEFPRPDFSYHVPFGGDVTQVTNWRGELEVHWNSNDGVHALAYDMPVTGGQNTAGMMRLWSARAATDFNFASFNRGDYIEAVGEKVQSETLSRVLYPNDSSLAGRELRLKQEFFLVSASLQDILHRHLGHGMRIEELSDRVAIQLNDTHPVLAVAELMRLLVDVHRLGWEKAWALTVGTFAFTNHTLLSEALETWPVPMFERLLPRHLQIIYEINARFLRDVMHRNPGDVDLLRRVSIIGEEGTKTVRMAHLAVVGSHRVNGVSHTHTQIMRQTLFNDFDRLWPDRILSLTNGISQRRWLADANPALLKLIGTRLGPNWFHRFDRLRELEPFAEEAGFRQEFAGVKRANKEALSRLLRDQMGIAVDPGTLFDLHIKRIHEYKRQLLNILQVIGRYNRIRGGAEVQARTVIFAGKAAPGYAMAKRIIQLILSVADIVNNDPAVRGLLKVVFVPNYNVTVAEQLIGAGDLSEQISTAGTEASGTGNMKLALNGALTIGTEDGANTEIRDAVGHDNIWMFGLRFAQIEALRFQGYDPNTILRDHAELGEVLDMVRGGYFAPQDRDLFQPIVDSLTQGGDRYFVLADYDAYVAGQAEIDSAYRAQDDWTRKAVLNVSRMSPFSMDRLVKQYAERVWNSVPDSAGA
ncbi:MAG: glycogen/starch/alpha-glucan phosphorylase, partial [Alphaproteobacteria bacterium]|nr:glycogen/starch/alpha-glucan phosphorylase [Alphaproteobacteria bacterium]